MNHRILISTLTFAAFMLASTSLWAAAGEGYSDSQWKDLGYRFMNFAVFFGVLFYFLRKPLPKFFRDRRENIAQNLEFLESQARSYEELSETLNKQIADIAAEREAILAQYERMGQDEANRLIAEAKKTAEIIVQRTEAAMEQEIKMARQTLLKDVVELAAQSAADLVKSNINEDDQKRLTYEFKEQVEKLKKAS